MVNEVKCRGAGWRTTLQWGACVGVALLLCLNAASAADTMDVKLDSGRVQGMAQGDVVSFKGIPFAAPPSSGRCVGGRRSRCRVGRVCARPTVTVLTACRYRFRVMPRRSA